MKKLLMVSLLGLTAGLAQAQTVNVICSVQAEWCNMIGTVYARTTGTKITFTVCACAKPAVKPNKDTINNFFMNTPVMPLRDGSGRLIKQATAYPFFRTKKAGVNAMETQVHDTGQPAHSTLKLNSCVASTSPPSVTQVYCSMAALTAA